MVKRLYYAKEGIVETLSLNRRIFGEGDIFLKCQFILLTGDWPFSFSLYFLTFYKIAIHV